MIADKIMKYLDSTGKKVDENILEAATGRFKQALIRQIMSDREDRPNQLYATMVTKKCARQSAYKFHGFKGADLSPRAKINFLIGDFVELTVLALAELAGAKVEKNNERLIVKGGGVEFACRPDGLINTEHGPFNVEIKKMSEYGYDEWERVGLSDDWGYRTQSQLECFAWKLSGVDVKGTCFVGIRGLTGHIREELIPYEEGLAFSACERALRVQTSTKDNLPERAWKPVPETFRGKPTGLMILPMQCSYCDFAQVHCWPEAKMEIKSGKPKFYIAVKEPNGI